MDEWKILPTLAQDVGSNKEALKLLSSEGDTWRAEQKFDGVRLLIHVHNGSVIGINRKGVVCNIPPKVAEGFVWQAGEWCWDGELVGSKYIVFDMPRALNEVTPDMPLAYRRQLLESIWPSLDMPDCVVLARSAASPEDRLRLAQSVRDGSGEGIMLKNSDAPYGAGKRTSDFRKWKWIKSVDCIVLALGIEGKQNMSIGMLDTDTGEIVEVATCTALAGDGPKVQVGDVVEVQCLYASKDNRLYQPTLPRIRLDKDPDECHLSQLEDIQTNKGIIE